MDANELLAKHKNKVIGAIVIVIAVLISYRIYQNQSSKREALKADIRIEQGKNEVLAELKKLEDRKDVFKKMLTPKETSKFIDMVSGFAKETGIEMSSVKPVVGLNKGDYIQEPFDLTVTAPDYHALAKFINKIESYKDIYIIESLSISSERGEGDSLRANFKVYGVAYP